MKRQMNMLVIKCSGRKQKPWTGYWQYGQEWCEPEYLGTGGLFLLYDTRRGLMRGLEMIQALDQEEAAVGWLTKSRSNDVCWEMGDRKSRQELSLAGVATLGNLVPVLSETAETEMVNSAARWNWWGSYLWKWWDPVLFSKSESSRHSQKKSYIIDKYIYIIDRKIIELRGIITNLTW